MVFLEESLHKKADLLRCAVDAKVGWIDMFDMHPYGTYPLGDFFPYCLNVCNMFVEAPMICAVDLKRDAGVVERHRDTKNRFCLWMVNLVLALSILDCFQLTSRRK